MRAALTALVLVCAVVCAATPARAAELRIAVMEFQSGGATGGDLESLGKGLQSMITTDLAQVAAFKLVERSRLADIRAELKLARSALVDRATAARIGKLAGATHLVTGTYTVVGGKMRIDTRVFGVADGQIVLAEKIEGEQDAFFELEKDLVGKLIAAVGVKLAPKERAEVARVHTADFEAFRKFSDGVELFDEKKYDEAVAALRDASSRDAGFKLAAVTLEEYERVITELRTKADAIESATAQLEQLKKDRSLKDELGMIEKLYARSRGGEVLERLAALQALALIYGEHDGYGHHEKLVKVQDELALQRTADTLWRSYYAESLKVFPLAPLGISVEMEPGLPKPDSFEADWPRFVERLRDFSAGGFNHEESLLYFGLDQVDRLAARLGLDVHGELDLRTRALALADKVHPPDRWRRDTGFRLAQTMRAAGEYGKSTALFSSLGAGEKEPGKLQELARELETNKELETTLAKAPLKALAKELLIIMPTTWSDDVQAEMRKRLLKLTKPEAWDLYVLTRSRRYRDEGSYVIVDGAQTWQVRGNDEVLQTGPRTDPRRGSELRYYRPERGPEAFVVVDGVPRADVDARFELVYTPAADWWPGMENPGRDGHAAAAPVIDKRRPEVAFAFAVRDVVAEDRPLRSLQLVVTDGEVRLCEVVQKDRWAASEVKVLERQAVDLRGRAKVEVKLRVSGGALAATVAGQELRFKVPGERTGFYGLAFRGPGYAAVTRLSTSGVK